MKRAWIMASCLSLCSGTAGALHVDRDQVNAAAPSAERLSTSEEIFLRVRKGVAELTLLELRKNEWILNAVGTSQSRVLGALADTAVTSALVGLLIKYTGHAWSATGAVAAADVTRDIEALRTINTTIEGYLKDPAGAAFEELRLAGVTAPELTEELALNEARITNLSAAGEPILARRVGRGLALVALPALALTLVGDLISVWSQVPMNAEQVAQRRVELEELIRATDSVLHPRPAGKAEGPSPATSGVAVENGTGV